MSCEVVGCSRQGGPLATCPICHKPADSREDSIAEAVSTSPATPGSGWLMEGGL